MSLNMDIGQSGDYHVKVCGTSARIFKSGEIIVIELLNFSYQIEAVLSALFF
jgi:hypothetical protein